MITIKTYDGVFLDMSSDVFISLKIAPNDIGDFATRGGVSSYDFSLPKTNKNTPYLNEITFDCSLLSNNRTISTGTISVYETDIQKGICNCTYSGSNSVWYEAIKGVLISDCSLDYTHIYCPDTVFSSFVKSDQFIYIPIEFGKTYRSADFPRFNTDTGDIIPSIYAHSLLKGILADAGVTASGDLFEDDTFLHTVIPADSFAQPNTAIIDVPTSLAGNTQTIIANDTILELRGGRVGIGAKYFNSISHQFKNLSGQRYLFKITGEVYLDASTGPIQTEFDFGYRRTNNGVSVKTVLYNNSLIFIGQSKILTVSVVIQLAVNEIIDFYFDLGAGGYFFDAQITKPIVFYGYLGLVGNIEINPITLLPKMVNEDFIKWIAVSFGCLFSFNDKTNDLTINMIKNLPFKVSDAIDWSANVSMVQSLNLKEVTSGFGNINNVTYTADGNDSLNLLLNGVGNGFFNITGIGLERVMEWYNAPFAATLQSISYIGNAGEYLIIPQIQRYRVAQESVASGQIEQGVRYINTGYTSVTYNGTAYTDGQTFEGISGISNYTVSGNGYLYRDSNFEEIESTPRVMIVRTGVAVGDVSGDTLPQINIIGTLPSGTFVERSCLTMPIGYFYPSLDIGFQDSLSYGDIGNVDNFGQTNMIDIYFTYLVRMLNAGKLYKFKMKLTETDISNLDYSKPIYIDYVGYSGYYFLSSIDGFDGKGLCDVYLLKMV